MTYKVDRKDRVSQLTDIPRSCIGAPIPVVVSDESKVMLAFILNQPDPDWDGTTSCVVSSSTDGEPIAIVSFVRARAHFFGPPNDEAFSGHPLASRGLEPYGAYEVINSSWIRELEKRNRVHSNHDRKSYLDGLRHFIFAFHDSTFECIARSYNIETTQGSILEVASKLVNRLEN